MRPRLRHWLFLLEFFVGACSLGCRIGRGPLCRALLDGIAQLLHDGAAAASHSFVALNLNLKKTSYVEL